MHAPCQSHVKIAFHVLRYLKSSHGTGISFKHGTYLNLCAYVDSDWAKCKITRKSLIGYGIYMGSNLVSCKSKKQSVLAKSSAKAKYRAMNNVTCGLMRFDLGDPHGEPLVDESTHEQTDDELTEKEAKQIEADDQAI
ncbi:ribonuclease H-like domain-containing protein [Tanacetum coccineum]